MDKNWYQHLSDAIKNKGYLQKDVAQRLGVSKQTISAWCSGRRTPNIEAINEIARMLNMTYNELLGADDLFVTDPQEKEAIKLLRELPPDSVKLALNLIETLQKNDS